MYWFWLLPNIEVSVVQIRPEMSEPFTYIDEELVEKEKFNAGTKIDLMKLSHYQNMQKAEIINIQK